MKVLIHGLGNIGQAIALGAKKNNTEYLTHDIDLNKAADFNEKTLGRIKEIEEAILHIITIDTNLNTKPELTKVQRNWTSDSYRIFDLIYDIVEFRGDAKAENDIFIIESTLEIGTMDFLQEFFKSKLDLVYSPERYLEDTRVENGFSVDPVKLIAFKDKEDAENLFLDDYYNIQMELGVKSFESCSYKTAEATKIVENTIRLVNLSLVNELNVDFAKNYPEIDFKDTMRLVATKLPQTKIQPGLIGGGCIPIDPLFLKSESLVLNQAIKHSISHPKELINTISGIIQKSNLGSVLLLGSAYKANSRSEKYSRYSNTLNNINGGITNEIQKLKFDHLVYNNVLPKETFIKILKSVDLVLVGADHNLPDEYVEVGIKTYLEFACVHAINIIDLNTFKIFKTYSQGEMVVDVMNSLSKNNNEEK